MHEIIVSGGLIGNPNNPHEITASSNVYFSDKGTDYSK